MCRGGEEQKACRENTDVPKTEFPWLEVFEQRVRGAGIPHWVVKGTGEVISKVLSNGRFVAGLQLSPGLQR